MKHKLGKRCEAVKKEKCCFVSRPSVCHSVTCLVILSDCQAHSLSVISVDQSEEGARAKKKDGGLCRNLGRPLVIPQGGGSVVGIHCQMLSSANSSSLCLCSLNSCLMTDLPQFALDSHAPMISARNSPSRGY